MVTGALAGEDIGIPLHLGLGLQQGDRSGTERLVGHPPTFRIGQGPNAASEVNMLPPHRQDLARSRPTEQQQADRGRADNVVIGVKS